LPFTWTEVIAQIQISFETMGVEMIDTLLFLAIMSGLLLAIELVYQIVHIIKELFY
jgi:hypothetical protein